MRGWCLFETGVWMEEMRSDMEGMFEKEVGLLERGVEEVCEI